MVLREEAVRFDGGAENAGHEINRSIHRNFNLQGMKLPDLKMQDMQRQSRKPAQKRQTSELM